MAFAISKSISVRLTIARILFLATLIGFAHLQNALADPQPFAFTYDGDSMGKGGVEVEQYITWQNSRPGEHGFNQADLKTELEFGLTDSFDLKLYAFNWQYVDDSQGHRGKFDNAGVEAVYYFTKPSESPIGFAVGSEVLVGRDELEFEQIAIVSKDWHEWSFVYNLKLETEIAGVFKGSGSSQVEVEGAIQHLFGASRAISPQLALGAEMRIESIYPNWSSVEDTAVHFGPAIHWNSDTHLWLTITPMFKLTGGADASQFLGRLLVGWNF